MTVEKEMCQRDDTELRAGSSSSSNSLNLLRPFSQTDEKQLR
jgi:hypothetical protein